MTDGLLSGLSVLDLSDSIAGQFATRLMADHGASVALAEPAAGTPTRRMGPCDSNGNSYLFWHLNAGKQSIVLPDESAARDELCRTVDVVVVGSEPLAQRLRSASPHTLFAVVTDFSPRGPYADWRGSELIFQALSGSMYVTGAPDRAPLYGVGNRASYSAGLWLYISILAALIGRRRHGMDYGPVAVSVHEAAAAMEENFSMRWAYSGEYMVRGNDPSRSVCTLACADGHAILFLRTAPGQWKALCTIVGGTELIKDERFSSWSRLSRNWFAAVEELTRRTERMKLEELVRQAEKSGIVIAAVETPQSLREESHLAARNFWQTVPTPEGERLALGALLNIQGKPARRNAPAPGIGTIDRVQPSLAVKAVAAQNIGPDSARPLAGMAVLDLTTAWAGPMSTKILALLGADVIKIEGPQWLDSWRGPLQPTKLEQYPGRVPGPRPYNCCARFNAQNHGKRDVVLDLKSPRAQALVRAMIARIDLVVANVRPGALARIGLGFDALRAINPAISMIEMPAVGEGPYAHRIGLGPTMEAMAGIAGCIGYEDGPPLGSGSSYLDPMGALHAAAGALTAIYGRLVHGGGSYIELAQREAAMHWIGEILLHAIETGQGIERNGNAIDTACPHGAFPAAGEDEWIAIAAFEDAQWQALCGVLDAVQWARDQRFATLASRTAHRSVIEALMAEKTRNWRKHELAARLQAAGVPAAPVVNGRDLFADPHLRANDWFTSLSHEDAGTHDYAGLPLVFGGARYRATSASPCFGAHTESVLREYAGVTATQVEELLAAGVTSRAPQG